MTAVFAGRRLVAGVVLHVLAGSGAAAQESTPARLAVDTVVAADTTVSEGGASATGFVADAVVSVALGAGTQLVTRPFVQRLSGTGEWNAQVWLAALRYEHVAPVALRVDAGYIPSPVGLANLQLRANLNPTIAFPASLFTALPRLEPGSPRTPLLGALYPLGASATASTLRWDVRGAVINSSPARPRRIFADDDPPNPPRFANVVIGGGVTPIVGVRIGASLTHGGWERAGETLRTTRSRSATIVTVESDVSFRHTRLQGEWTRDRFTVADGAVVARGWFVQGLQALTPRWFAAARVERLSAPAITGEGPSGITREPQRFVGSEETLGYRLTPELTLRVSHRVRYPFGRAEADHAAAVSVVWWRRWR